MKTDHPELFGLVSAGNAEPEASERYTNVLEHHPDSLACLYDITTAMSQIHLPSGTPLEYLCELIWDDSMAQDRFFASERR